MVIRVRRLAEPHDNPFLGLGHCLVGRKIPEAHRTFITEARVQVGGIVWLEAPEAQPPSDERRECVGCLRQVVESAHRSGQLPSATRLNKIADLHGPASVWHLESDPA